MEIKGKYNTAKIFTENVEQEAISQIYSLTNIEWLKNSVIRSMPDIHAGKGCTVGTTIKMKDRIIFDKKLN
jgi:RNA-splicing ligase RtcB